MAKAFMGMGVESYKETRQQRQRAKEANPDEKKETSRAGRGKAREPRKGRSDNCKVTREVLFRAGWGKRAGRATKIAEHKMFSQNACSEPAEFRKYRPKIRNPESENASAANIAIAGNEIESKDGARTRKLGKIAGNRRRARPSAKTELVSTRPSEARCNG